MEIENYDGQYTNISMNNDGIISKPIVTIVRPCAFNLKKKSSESNVKEHRSR